jgi:ketosteroid isomerase-like protein
VSEENKEILRDQYAATNARDFERVMSHYAEDVVLTVHDRQYLNAGTIVGREAVGRWFGDWLSSFARDARFEITELTELADGSILVVADHHARGRASGAEVHDTLIWVYRLREGKITHLRAYGSRDQALADAGRGA